jgi:ABC-type phosphate transport system ATPase subunit
MAQRIQTERAGRRQVELNGDNIYAPATDVVLLRRRVGMVFQKPIPFRRFIFDNVAYGLKINKMTQSKAEFAGRVGKPRRCGTKSGTG